MEVETGKELRDLAEGRLTLEEIRERRETSSWRTQRRPRRLHLKLGSGGEEASGRQV